MTCTPVKSLLMPDFFELLERLELEGPAQIVVTLFRFLTEEDAIDGFTEMQRALFEYYSAQERIWESRRDHVFRQLLVRNAISIADAVEASKACLDRWTADAIATQEEPPYPLEDRRRFLKMIKGDVRCGLPRPGRGRNHR